MPDLPEPLRAVHEQTAASMRGVEEAVLIGLRSRVESASFRRGPERVARDVAETVMLGRRLARQSAAARLGAEIDAAGLRGPMVPGLPVPTDADRLAAAQASQAYADVVAKHLETVPTATAIRKADYLLSTIAASQVSEAFNDERERLEQANGAQYAGVLVKLWDAKDDRRTCPVCDKLDGKLRPWGLAFPDGNVPGKVHKKCRCRWNPVPVFLVG